MKFQELKQSLKVKVEPIYLLYGDDEFVKTSAKKLIVDPIINGNQLNLTTFYLDELDAFKVLDTLNTFSFFGKRCVVINEIEGKKDTKLINELKEYAQNPNNECVLVIVGLTSSNFESLGSSVTMVDCNRLSNDLLAKWIVHKLNGKKTISSSSAYKLIDYCNGYLGRINLELDKLLNYSLSEITSEDIENLVIKDIEYNIFELAESLGQRKKEKAISIFNDLINDKKQSTSVLVLIANHFRRLFYVSVSKDTNEQIAEYLGVKPYAVKKLKEQQANFSPKILMQIVRDCEEIDVATKTGKMNYMTSMQIFMSKLLSKM